MWRLARDSGALDLNTSYAYLLFARDFADTCKVAVVDGEVVGFVLGYRRPTEPETLFVWQIAVDARLRGHGLAARLLEAVAEDAEQTVRRNRLSWDARYALDAPWADEVHSPRHGPGHVTDGPFLHRGRDGSLVMLWASFAGGSYAQGAARSTSGGVLGPWEHQPEPLFSSDGGHGMIFTTFEGQPFLTVHTPNQTPHERAVLIPLREGDGTISVEKEVQ